MLLVNKLNLILLAAKIISSTSSKVLHQRNKLLICMAHPWNWLLHNLYSLSATISLKCNQISLFTCHPKIVSLILTQILYKLYIHNYFVDIYYYCCCAAATAAATLSKRHSKCQNDRYARVVTTKFYVVTSLAIPGTFFYLFVRQILCEV